MRYLSPPAWQSDALPRPHGRPLPQMSKQPSGLLGPSEVHWPHLRALAAALTAAAQVLAPGGRAVITHPLGAAFVDELHERDASVVPAGLPRTLLDMEELVPEAPLTPAFVEDAVPYFSEFVRD